MLIIALFLSILTFINHRGLKKRFDIVERMLAWKNVLNHKETKWENLPKDVKDDISEWNKGI